MTRTAIYSLQDNTLTEQPAMEKPPIDVDEFPEGTTEWLALNIRWGEYNAHVDQCRTIPCHDSARSLWKDGQKVEEGKDYEIKEVDWMPETEEEYNQAMYESRHELAGPVPKVLTAFPLPVKSELPLAHIGAGETIEKQETLCRDAAHILTETNNPNLSKEDSAYWNRWREYFTALWKLIEQGYIITKR